MSRVARFAAALLLLAAVSEARVISYAPYTDRAAVPAVQNRLNRHFVLIEQQGSSGSGTIVSPPPAYGYYAPSQLVVYDSAGNEEPRVVFPSDGFATITSATAREEAGVLSILIQTGANFLGANPNNQLIWLFSNDGGTSWMKLDMPPATSAALTALSPDVGGPFARGRYSSTRVGTREVPFVIGTAQGVYAVSSVGTVKQIFSSFAMNNEPLLGSDREGRKFLVRTSTGIYSVDINGNQSTVTNLSAPGSIEGWIAPDGGVFLEHVQNIGQVVLFYAKDGTINPVAASWDGAPNVQPPINASWVFFAVPTADYAGAWIIRRGGGRPTQLYRFQPCNCAIATPPPDLALQWQDVSNPEVEALHPAASGNKLLIQVHRPRQSVDNLMFKDPALAIWNIGAPAPRAYDELFLSETSSKGFVHLDVDAVAGGAPFVFDSGVPPAPGGVIISPAPPSGGGSDVVQEWGVVRASLRQQLVLPGVGKTKGAFGSNWASDLILYNPADAPVDVQLLYVPNGFRPILVDPPLPSMLVKLQAHEIRLIQDVVGSLFHYDNTSGALYVTPPVGAGVNVTARTYNTAVTGTYGFTMNGIDMFTAAGPRFPLSFSGAFQGSNFRTNLMLTDASGRGTEVAAAASNPNGSSATEVVTFTGPEGGQTQINGVASLLGLSSADNGALVLRPSKGETLASLFVVDNRTNDPTFFPPDIPASVLRVIPAIGHLDGANGSKFRSDLYLFNNSASAKMLTMQAKLWDVPENPTTLQFTLLPFEARVIRDVLATAFGKTGIARLRVTSQTPTSDTSVRVTSRTYTVDADGGTYGFLMPPLNSFQSGSPGDTLEILGATLDPHFRTNLGLVDLTGFPGPRPARAKIDIIDNAGNSLDSFEVSIPSAGGMQINDIFHARGLPEAQKPVLIRVTTIEGMIGAYGAFVDNATNDPAYIAANLAAHAGG
jgi:hypothetical protein